MAYPFRFDPLQGIFLSVLAKTQFVQNAKTQFENAKTQFEKLKSPILQSLHHRYYNTSPQNPSKYRPKTTTQLKLLKTLRN